MGCASNDNVKTEEENKNKNKLSNGKEGLNNKEKNGGKSEEKEDEDYLEIPTSKNQNTDSKIIGNPTNIPKIYNINNNFNKNQSTDLKDNNMIKNSQKISDNKKQDNNLGKNGTSFNQLKNLNISKDKENDSNEKKDNLNFGNYDEENDDMCNLMQSMDIDKVKNDKNKKENENKEICVIFEMQSSGAKYNINVKQNIKLFELIEIFKKKIKLSSFENPEFVFNTVFLVDFDKTISDYKIGDNSIINVFV